MPSWASAFILATVVALAAVPRLRHVALRSGFVDIPDPRKLHPEPVPYLGGVAIILAVLAGVVVEARMSARAALLVLTAAVLGTLGLIDDDRNVSPRLRLLLELAAATGAVALGVRIHASGSPAADIALTLVWIVGITNAFNLLDNMDGLAAGVAATASLAVFALAFASGQPVVATFAAATAGASIGFLVYNRPPASVFMGDTGSLFLGFVLAILTVNVNSALDPPTGFAIPLLILAVPIFDTTTVTLARLRRGLRVSEGGKDHLSHRLAHERFSRPTAVGVLVATAGLLGFLGVLAGRRVIPLWTAAALAVAALAVLGYLALPAQVYSVRGTALPRRVRLGLVAMLLGVVIVAAPALLAATRAAAQVREGRRLLSAALAGADSQPASANVEQLHRAESAFGAARDRLSNPLVSLGLAIPGPSSNVAALKTLVESGEQLARAAATLSEVRERSKRVVAQGSVSLDEVREWQGPLREAASTLERVQQRLVGVERVFLVPGLNVAVRSMTEELIPKRAVAENAAATADLLPALLGADGTRRYFLAFQDSAELRGSGGYIGNWGELVADNGRLRLERFGPSTLLQDGGPVPKPVELPPDFVERWKEFDVKSQWQNVNVSPDFPTTAAVVEALYPKSGGAPIDGVIALDPAGLAALLNATGPVTISGWPDPITAENVVDVTLRQAHERFPGGDTSGADRVEFLGEVAHAVTEAFITGPLDAERAIGAFAKARQGGHLMAYFNKSRERDLVSRLRADGSIPSPAGDSLMVVNQNGTSNQLDVYLRRHVRYDVRVDPGRKSAAVTGTVDVTLQNQAPTPATPQPGSVSGGVQSRENRTYLSVYTPFRASSTTVEGQPASFDSHRDLNRTALSGWVSIGPEQARTVQVGVEGRVKLTPDGWYRLDVLDQPSLTSDSAYVRISVPSGWRIAEAKGARIDGGRTAEGDLHVDGARTVWVRLERTGLGRVWDALAGRW